MKYVDEENGLVRTDPDYVKMERKMMHRNDSRWIGNGMNIPVTADALDTNPSHMIFEAPLGRLEKENGGIQWPLKCKYKIFTLEFASILC